MRSGWACNCSACHTNEIAIDDRRLRIEGAPTLADFQGFEEQILQALQETRGDRAKFDRFARAVLGHAMSVDSRASLQAQLDEQIAWQRKLLDKNASPVRYGHGRLDAQGHILNKVALTTLVGGQPTSIKADAPASYPFIWNTSQQDKLQWNGIANDVLTLDIFGRQTDLGALVRNTSEVIGVYAQIETSRGKALRGYDSSLRLPNMVALERQLERLQSPRWPEDLLGPIDWEKAARGKAIYDSACVSCHAELAPSDTTTPIKVTMSPLDEQRTDVFLACNTFLHESLAGNLEGQRVFAVTGERIKRRDKTSNMLVNASVGAILGQFTDLVRTVFTDVAPSRDVGRMMVASQAAGPDYLPGVSDDTKKADAETCLQASLHIGSDRTALLQYKARPLNGIWATAPYLHNGSVPTLYDLLLPSALVLVTDEREPSDPAHAGGAAGPTRPETFAVGARAFDPKKVGFATTPAAGDQEADVPVFHVRDPQSGEPIPGNYNTGHNYGTGLTDEQRWDLVEYLKTL